MEKTAEALKRNEMEAFVVENGAAAKAKVMEMVPVGAEVMCMSSATLEVKTILVDLPKRI
ncbi:MAG: hypothetical protein UX52_C0036G0005 [Candidatus Amesbacteria bacterium GW2011_GWA1_46_35]|uniref:LUD domain-containing protein n=1 Tax=Candidatus Amesbacteria bacterium GW2011_GWC2_45_19 TaxID=1618366 RepID=A0A0G1P8J5_9BACT|nr:MAG: hypothetical protein UX05_C0018G0005 [Candidatus Amesbacteria bacterium GW2011_GWC2_45_19]KKU36920.1 MAG: hypothetical protein UX52_C0036G0005 [Candidatus Amesbacteria bacterium GW2011_GWA1_46_35]KKU68100.1 MAG: hypothetical protein UX93_C0011G0005 [Microgenomates group bacterium GW2011_GWC1_47_20]